MTPDRIPLVDLAVVNDLVGGELRSAFERVLRSSAFTGGAEVEAFEHAFGAHLGVEHVVAVASGTAALHLALVAGGVGRGDEVILPPNTFFATLEAVVAAGATPVLADVDRSTALLDVDAAAAAITPRTAAIIPVHLYGQPVDADRFTALASRHGLLLLEDAAQAFGASWRDRPAGTIGSAAAFSFYPSKNLGALGDGGAVTTPDPALARSVRLLRSHGEERRHEHLVVGACERLDGLQAAFLAAKLAAAPRARDLLERAIERYRPQLEALPGVTPIATAVGAVHAHHLLVVRVPQRDRVLQLLHDAGIGAAVHYPTPLHHQPAARDLLAAGRYPEAEALAGSILSMPLFPGISDAQIDRCVDSLMQALEQAA
jgi:dTDP-4-amino-4,6-dideoxygalactose transaminase